LGNLYADEKKSTMLTKKKAKQNLHFGYLQTALQAKSQHCVLSQTPTRALSLDLYLQPSIVIVLLLDLLLVLHKAALHIQSLPSSMKEPSYTPEQLHHSDSQCTRLTLNQNIALISGWGKKKHPQPL
jgi:hypothetical protein